ncbi:MAG TPA: hypothetical protein V6D10_07220 [Trichocoleus sp.]|jgi:putative hemolysin
MLTIDILTGPETEQLQQQESRIEQGLKAFFWEVGDALSTIQTQRLYRAQFDTFEDYCRERWQFSSDYAYKLIRGAETIATLKSADVSNLPTTESQTRELTKLSNPEQQIEAWVEASQNAPAGKPNATQVKQAVQQVQKRSMVTPGSRVKVTDGEHQGKELEVAKTENSGAVVYCKLDSGESYPFLAGEVETVEVAPAPAPKPKIDHKKESQDLKTLLHRCLPYLPVELQIEVEAAIGNI